MDDSISDKIKRNPGDFVAVNRKMLASLVDEPRFDATHPAYRAIQSAKALAGLLNLQTEYRFQIEVFAETADELLLSKAELH